MAFEILAIGSCYGDFGGVQWLDHDLLAGPPDVAQQCVVWSGALSEDRFEPSPVSWLPGARGRLQQALEGLPESVLIRPHYAQVLNDVPGTRSMLAHRGGRPVAIDLAALLAPSMVVDGEQHVDRIFHGLSSMASAALISDALVDETGRTRAVPVGQGVLPGQCVGQALMEWLEPRWPASTPVCVLSPSVASAKAWLGLPSAV